MRRRSLLQFLAGASGTVGLAKVLTGCMPSSSVALEDLPTEVFASNWHMPDESAPHRCTWMAFGPSAQVWGADLLPFVQDDLARIAQAIAQYEPVNMLVREADYDTAVAKCGTNHDITFITTPLDDLWIRDTGPVFVVNQTGEKAAIDFNFNGWGEKQAYRQDAMVARRVAELTQTQRINTSLVLEGGGIEVDGEGTAIITESCVLNDNRNPGWSKTEIEEALMPLLGLHKIIWLPGVAGQDITDGHTDFYARFTRPGTVVAALEPDPDVFDYDVMLHHLEILREATDAAGRTLEVVPLNAPTAVRPEYANDADFAAGYINFYVVNGAVLLPEFGDVQADADAKTELSRLFPERDIVQLQIDAIAAGGGGIHCATQQEPLT